MPRDHEGQCDLCVLVGHDSPQQVLNHDGIFILPTTVVGVQVYRVLAQPMVCKEMVKHTHDGVGSLPHVNSLIDQVVDPSGDGLTTHTKNGTLLGCQEVHGAGLERVVRIEHLVHHVETVVGMDGSAVRWSLCCR